MKLVRIGCFFRSNVYSWLDVAVFPVVHARWREYHSGPKMEPEKVVGQNMMGRSILWWICLSI